MLGVDINENIRFSKPKTIFIFVDSEPENVAEIFKYFLNRRFFLVCIFQKEGENGNHGSINQLIKLDFNLERKSGILGDKVDELVDFAHLRFHGFFKVGNTG